MTPNETIPLTLLGSDGTEAACCLQLAEEDDGFLLRLQGIAGSDQAFEGRDETLFDALVALRRKLEPLGYLLRCAGSALDVYPSGMSRSMGEGRRAYRLTLGKPALTKDLIDIFEASPNELPATLAQQEAFFQQWLQSLR